MLVTIPVISQPVPDVIHAVKQLRGEGIKTAVLTNNWKTGKGNDDGLLFEGAFEHFDSVIQSCQVGLRKPDPAIYRKALDSLGGVLPEEAVFLDDIGSNLKPAQEMGMTTIKVDDIHTALVTLEKAVGIGFTKSDQSNESTTSEVRHGMELNEAKLKEYLETLLGQSAKEVSVKQFQHGQSNPTYLVTFHPSGDQVWALTQFFVFAFEKPSLLR